MSDILERLAKSSMRDWKDALHRRYWDAAAEISRLRTQVSTLQARVEAGDRLRESCKYIKLQLDVALPNTVFPVFEESLATYDALKTAATIGPQASSTKG
jgi:hypothetical protein